MPRMKKTPEELRLARNARARAKTQARHWEEYAAEMLALNPNDPKAHLLYGTFEEDEPGYRSPEEKLEDDIREAEEQGFKP